MRDIYMCFYCHKTVRHRRVAVCQILAHQHCLKVALGDMEKPKKWPDDWNKRALTPPPQERKEKP